MEGSRNELDPRMRAEADAELTAQVNQAFNERVETTRKLSQHSFLVNSGGAVATLAFVGNNPNASFALVPLIFFLVGVIASGMELRFLLKSLVSLHHDAIDRRSRFALDRLPLSKAMPGANVGSPHTKRSAWSGGHCAGHVSPWSTPRDLRISLVLVTIRRAGLMGRATY